MSEIETKYHSGRIIECKEETRNGVRIGIVAGYIATWDVDLGSFGVRDRFLKGAFAESIQEHKDRDDRQIRMLFRHGEIIGGFPIDTVKEDNIGLFGIGEVNLAVPEGATAFSLAKQGVLVDFSIGFRIVESETETTDDEIIRIISKARIFEGSIVPEPMNPEAKITEVKTINVDEVTGLTDLKSLEKLLRSSGFSKNAAVALIKAATDFKADDRSESGNSEDDDNQGDPESQKELLSTLTAMNKKADSTRLLSSLKSINSKGNSHE